MRPRTVVSQHGAQAVENVADLLTCPVCMESFDDNDRQPKLLPCHHSFCKLCLQHLVSRQPHIDCPTCRQRTSMPDPESVNNLQTNFYLTNMKDLLGEGARPKVKVCRKHGQKELTLFCKTCEVLICIDCVTGDHKESNGHNTQPLPLAMQEQRALLNIEIANAQETIMKSRNRLASLESELTNLFIAKDAVVKEIDDTFDKYIETLIQRKQVLQTQASEVYKGRKTVVSNAIEDIKRDENTLSALIEQCQEASQSENISDILAYRTKVGTKSGEIRRREQTDVGNNFLQFQTDESQDAFLQILPDLGSIELKKALPSVVKFSAQRSVASLFTNMNMTVKSISGEDLKNYPIEVEIQDVYDDEVPCLCQHRGNGRYELTFRPQVSGMHRLKAKFLGRSIPGGSYMLNVQSNNPVMKIGDRGSGLGEMEYPRALTTDSRNNFYVVDTGNNRILKYDKTGKLVFGFPISEDNDALSSCGIAFSPAQNSLICTEVNVQEADLAYAHSILVYNSEGQLCNRLSYPGTLKRALSVAVNSLGHIIIADFQLDTIFIFDKQGRLLRKFGESGSGPGQFNNPTFLCIGENDCIIVSDGDNHRIQVFDRLGKFLYQFGSRGSGKGQFEMTFGVAADHHGNILVVDGGNKRIQIFKNGGDFVSCLESEGDKMNAPRGIATTSDGQVLVADRDNHCVKKYRYLLCTSI